MATKMYRYDPDPNPEFIGFQDPDPQFRIKDPRFRTRKKYLRIRIIYGTLLSVLNHLHCKVFSYQKGRIQIRIRKGMRPAQKVLYPVLQYLNSGLSSGAAWWGSWRAWSGSHAPPCSYLERLAHRMAHLQNVDSHNVQYNELLKVVNELHLCSEQRKLRDFLKPLCTRF
jgi:hypothetical protein